MILNGQATRHQQGCEKTADDIYTGDAEHDVLDEIHTSILQEEEDVRIESERVCDCAIDSDMEAECSEPEHVWLSEDWLDDSGSEDAYVDAELVEEYEAYRESEFFLR